MGKTIKVRQLIVRETEPIVFTKKEYEDFLKLSVEEKYKMYAEIDSTDIVEQYVIVPNEDSNISSEQLLKYKFLNDEQLAMLIPYPESKEIGLYEKLKVGEYSGGFNEKWNFESPRDIAKRVSRENMIYLIENCGKFECLKEFERF